MKLNLIARTSALVLAGGLGLALAAHAQEGTRPHHQGGPAHHAKHDHGVRLQDLKAKLKLTPAQESAWTAFEASMKPVSSSAVPPKMEALAKMNAIGTFFNGCLPEVIDKELAVRGITRH